MKRKPFRRVLPIMLLISLLSGCGSSDNQSSFAQSSNAETSPATGGEPIKEVEPPVSSEPAPVVDIALIQQTYIDMQNAAEHLSFTSNGYAVKDYPISRDSVTKIGNEFVVNQGVIYDEIAAGLSLYCKYGLSQVLDEDFFKILTDSDTEPDNWNELAHELNEFILSEGTDIEIISKLEALSCVNGAFDYESRIYEFIVTDLVIAVEELHISEEMLGHVISKLSEYPSEIVFDDNSVSISLEVKTFG